jgi:hypothetical protein
VSVKAAALNYLPPFGVIYVVCAEHFDYLGAKCSDCLKYYMTASVLSIEYLYLSRHGFICFAQPLSDRLQPLKWDVDD